MIAQLSMLYAANFRAVVSTAPVPVGWEKIKVIDDQDDSVYVLIEKKVCGRCGGPRHGSDCTGLCPSCKTNFRKSDLPARVQTKVEAMRPPMSESNGHSRDADRNVGVSEPAPPIVEKQKEEPEMPEPLFGRIWKAFDSTDRATALKKMSEEIFPLLPPPIQRKLISAALDAIETTQG